MQEERQAIERQKAAAAAAALEVSAAETAVRAVKEREEVIALLEKEKEELQIEAAEASERHAKEVSFGSIKLCVAVSGSRRRIPTI